MSLLGTFAAGPAYAIEYVRDERPAEAWLDDVWCEGAALIDTVSHVLVLFTWHHDGVGDRARRSTAIKTAWPGWEVRWAYGGIEDVVAYLGLDRASVRVAHRREFVPLPGSIEYPEDDNCVVTVRHAGGVVYGYRLQHVHCEPRWAGPGLLDGLAALTPVRSWEPQSKHDCGPELGLHFDLASLELGFWTVENFTGTVEEIAARWPGWRVVFWEDRHEEQTLRCGDDFRTFPFAST
ncbi:hypothetical protein [Lentzea sp. HUAS12]|uniref:hypothetical protein n=1 Tax=Lentzea sp. HUAS12 TaxID=2951806 RepID=UPI0020A102A0|nr:hypothetical protein [Lentzea sp. HUAS12]USX49347.1 hypothetical protein ND450_28365 [Lentzea sp. HUAS12]